MPGQVKFVISTSTHNRGYSYLVIELLSFKISFIYFQICYLRCYVDILLVLCAKLKALEEEIGGHSPPHAAFCNRNFVFSTLTYTVYAGCMKQLKDLENFNHNPACRLALTSMLRRT